MFCFAGEPDRQTGRPADRGWRWTEFIRYLALFGVIWRNVARLVTVSGWALVTGSRAAERQTGRGGVGMYPLEPVTCVTRAVLLGIFCDLPVTNDRNGSETSSHNVSVEEVVVVRVIKEDGSPRLMTWYSVAGIFKANLARHVEELGQCGRAANHKRRGFLRPDPRSARKRCFALPANLAGRPADRQEPADRQVLLHSGRSAGAVWNRPRSDGGEST
jgi:hypothetical protein